MNVSEGNIAVLTDVHAKPGCEEYLFEVYSDAVERYRGNAAAIQYRLHVDTADHAHLVFYEIWRDSEAIDRYHASESFKAMLDRAMPGTASVNIYRFRSIPE